MERKKVSIADLMSKKQQGKKITMLTAYDYPLASLVDKAEMDMILVGDSVGMVVLGYENTLPVTMEEMIHHSKAVKRAVKYAYLVGDMPFMSYQVSVQQAVANAGRFIKEGGCDAVKLEGGATVSAQVEAIIKAGIPVQGHLGLTPQSAAMLGEFKVRGKDASAAQKILDDARLLEKIGVFSVILECVPDELARVITQNLNVPAIGIGAGPWGDGQGLVTHDMVGLFERFTPKFVKKYTNVSLQMLEAFKAYKQDVENIKFPAAEHSFTMKKEEAERLK